MTDPHKSKNIQDPAAPRRQLRQGRVLETETRYH